MKQGIFQLIYFTYLHNQLLIGLVLAGAASLFLLIRKPERRYVWFLLGFAVLAFHFSYQKHIVDQLADQTVATVFLDDGGASYRRLLDLFLYHFLPFLFWLIGWGSIILGIFDPPRLMPKFIREKLGLEKREKETAK